MFNTLRAKEPILCRFQAKLSSVYTDFKCNCTCIEFWTTIVNLTFSVHDNIVYALELNSKKQSCIFSEIQVQGFVNPNAYEALCDANFIKMIHNEVD